MDIKKGEQVETWHISDKKKLRLGPMRFEQEENEDGVTIKISREVEMVKYK